MSGSESKIDIRCIPNKGVIISDILNIEGNYLTGQAAPESKHSSINYCKRKQMPSLVSSNVQFLINIYYSPGDAFKVGYKSVTKNTNIPITNIVFMGMGEPFLNYRNVIESCKYLQIIKHLTWELNV